MSPACRQFVEGFGPILAICRQVKFLTGALCVSCISQMAVFCIWLWVDAGNSTKQAFNLLVLAYNVFAVCWATRTWLKWHKRERGLRAAQRAAMLLDAAETPGQAQCASDQLNAAIQSL